MANERQVKKIWCCVRWEQVSKACRCRGRNDRPGKHDDEKLSDYLTKEIKRLVQVIQSRDVFMQFYSECYFMILFCLD